MTKSIKTAGNVVYRARNSGKMKKISNFICMFSDLCLYLHLKSSSAREKLWEKCVPAHGFPSFVDFYLINLNLLSYEKENL